MRNLLPRPRTLAKLLLLALIVLALTSVLLELRPLTPTPARLALRDSSGYLLAGFAPDSRTVVGISCHVDDKGSHWRGPLRLWDAGSGEVKATLAPEWTFCWPPLRFSPDGR